MRLAGDDVHRARKGLELPDRADDVVLAPADALDGEGCLARSEQGVATHVVGRSAGVTRLALHDQLEPPGAGDRRHHRERLTAPIELGPLLDVRLEVADQLVRAPARLADAAGIEAELEEGLPQGRPVRVGQRPPFVIPDAGHRRRAQQSLAETGALLVRERHDLERERQRGDAAAALAVRHPQQPHDLQRHEHAGDPVEAARVGHRVQVRAEHQGGRIGGLGLPAPAPARADPEPSKGRAGRAGCRRHPAAWSSRLRASIRRRAGSPARARARGRPARSHRASR